MTGSGGAPAFFVGWDVGGWNCENNQRSRDALVALDGGLRVVGRSWRGNLRTPINRSTTAQEFVDRLLGLCGAGSAADGTRVVLAIDTPLGFSREFVQLVVQREAVPEPLGASAANPYLYRRTERYLAERGHQALSAVKDMIGSQATKGMHVLARFAPLVESCGVWRSREDGVLTALEAYPSGSKGSRVLESLRTKVKGQVGDRDDKRDALTCALIAYLYGTRPHDLDPPDGSVPEGEGWIWLPRDALRGESP